MIITQIKKIGRGDRYYLILDEYKKFTIEADILARHKLKTNDEIDEELLNEILLENYTKILKPLYPAEILLICLSVLL